MQNIDLRNVAGTRFLLGRGEEAQCPIDLGADDACRLVAELCRDFDSDGLIPYLRLYTCTPRSGQPLLLACMLLWLGVLFAGMASAAAGYLARHLQIIVRILNISESLAGVTIFAFANGCTDLFSTFAAMGANSGSLAISELYGAAAFITAVVLGLIALIEPFNVEPGLFAGDVLWFIVAASLLLAFLADGELVLGECLAIVAVYLGFVCFALFRTSRRGDPTIPIVVQDLGAQPGELTTNDDATDPLLWSGNDTEDHGITLRGNDGCDDSTPSGPTTQRQSPEQSAWRNFPPLQSWRDQSTGERLLTGLSLPLLFPVGVSIPLHLEDEASKHPRVAQYLSSEHANSNHMDSIRANELPADSPLVSRVSLLWSLEDLKKQWPVYLPLILGPQLLILISMKQAVATKAPYMVIGVFVAAAVSVMLIVDVFSTRPPAPHTRAIFLNSTLGFLTSLTWIYLTATSAVSLLMTLALILDIPTALLGATVFAIGQSSNDLVANTAVAKSGMPILASSATFGGPLMNMLLGIGGGGLVQVLKLQASGQPASYGFSVEPGLFVSASSLLLGLTCTLCYVFWNGWKLDRKLGVCLIVMWSVLTAVNVIVSFRSQVVVYT